MQKLNMQDAIKARDNISDAQKAQIAALYQNWADEIKKQAENISATKKTPSAALNVQYLNQLYTQMQETSKDISNEIYNKIKQNIYTVSDAVVKANAEWLYSMGFGVDGVNAALSYIPDMTVRNLITGQIYDTGWSLSAAIWGDNEKTLKDIYQIIAEGRAKQLSVFEVSQRLESYVSPSRKLPWNLRAPDGVKIYKKKVDYNAQRLARTLIQHSYQQSFVAATQPNPFVLKYRWNANGSRACQLCLQRNGTEYKKNELPLDHPNGMCVMEPVIADNYTEQLVNWYKADEGVYPDIDEYAKSLGYIPEPKTPVGFGGKAAKAGFDGESYKEVQKQLEAKLGWSRYQDIDGEIWKQKNIIGGGMTKEDYYKAWAEGKIQNPKLDKWLNVTDKPAIFTGGTVITPSVPVIKTAKEFTDTYGFSKAKNWQSWFNSLDAQQKQIIKDIKLQSGLKWQDFYEQNIKQGGKPKAQVNTNPVLPNLASTEGFNKQAYLDMLKSQHTSQMLATEAKQFSKMSDIEANAISMYTGASYGSMNGYLRLLGEGKSNSEAEKESHISTQELDAVFNAIRGLEKASLESEVYLRRGTSFGDIAGIIGGDYKDTKHRLANMSVDELRAECVNKVGVLNSFTSTSSNYEKGFFRNIEIIYRCPAGSQATSIMSKSRFGTSEGETLLNAGTMVVIKGVEEIPESERRHGNVRFYMDVLGCNPPKRAI